MGNPGLGAAAVVGAIAAFGSFGVPIKSRRLQEAQVHPLTVQCYKTAACFATCWLALLAVPLRFTWWGTAGAAIWVLNGIAAIVAIQAAGLAVAQALWSGLSVFVAFLWGTAVFHEPVASLPLALMGLCLMAVGMAAVGVISSRGANTSQHHGQLSLPAPDVKEAETQRLMADGRADSSHPSELELAAGAPPPRHPQLPEALGPPPSEPPAPHGTPDPIQSGLPDGEAASCSGPVPGPAAPVGYAPGIACAVYVGIANGSFLVPLKYANCSVTGLEYLVSFGVGAALITAAAAAAYSVAAARLGWPGLRPAVRAAAPPALLAGLLWSAGNALAIVATQELGLALAWPAIQVQLLVSTAWGAAYYGEVAGGAAVAGLLAGSAGVVAGFALLAAAKG